MNKIVASHCWAVRSVGMVGLAFYQFDSTLMVTRIANKFMVRADVAAVPCGDTNFFQPVKAVPYRSSGLGVPAHFVLAFNMNFPRLRVFVSNVGHFCFAPAKRAW